MTRRLGSGPWLLLLVAGFLLAFAAQRGRSTFLRIEGERAAAADLAAANGLTVADVFALRDLVGVDASREQWRDAVSRFVGYRALEVDDAVAAAMVAGTNGPDSVPVRRFVLMRERFSQRAAARH